jgi:uncharacterized protein YndB with AHSA1/START domain
MDAELDATIRPTADMNEVHFERQLQVPAEEAWRYVAEPDLLGKWMGGDVERLQLVEDGEIVIQMTQVGATISCKVLEIDPHRLLAITWDVPAWGNIPDLYGSTMRIEVQSDGTGSKFLLTHAMPNAAGREHLMAAAWHDHLDELQQMVTGTGEDFVIKAGRLVELTMGYLDQDFEQRRAEYERFLNITTTA